MSNGNNPWQYANVAQANSMPNLRHLNEELEQAIVQSRQPPTPPENESPDERAARLRQERFERIQVHGVPPSMDNKDYNRMYRGRTRCHNRIVMKQVEEAIHCMFCPKCVKDEEQGGISASRFYVVFEKDELGVFPSLAHLTCHNCGFEEFYPMRQQHPTMEEELQKKQYENQIQSKSEEIRKMQQYAMQQQNAAHQHANMQGIGIAGSAIGALGMQGALDNVFGGPLNQAKAPPPPDPAFTQKLADFFKKYAK
jgi:predicted nucleic-acid-binding Zn-ribbon protein